MRKPEKTRENYKKRKPPPLLILPEAEAEAEAEALTTRVVVPSALGASRNPNRH